jgi:hypothetical protein
MVAIISNMPIFRYRLDTAMPANIRVNGPMTPLLFSNIAQDLMGIAVQYFGNSGKIAFELPIFRQLSQG